ncbi:hypothetical protein [Weissella confusa]|uniref:hypothetical protein n=1 Tax=Weissella confusa TaxID=1583 RepID=UPI0018F2568C|nr:hypothetical protein [Weissella confusa]MBJ7693518.1 hypothetical protein [Weissella confusa]
MDRKQTVVFLSSLIGFVITILLIQFGFIKTILVVFITVMFGLLGILFDNNRIQLSKLLQEIFNK